MGIVGRRMESLGGAAHSCACQLAGHGEPGNAHSIGMCPEPRMHPAPPSPPRSCVTGDVAAVKAMLKAGANPNALSSIGPFGLLAHTSALGRAAAAGHAAVVEELLRAGARPDAGSSTGPFAAFTRNSPLWDAAAAGHAETVRTLLRHGADAGEGFSLGPGGLLVRFSSAVCRRIPVGNQARPPLCLRAGLHQKNERRSA